MRPGARRFPGRVVLFVSHFIVIYEQDVDLFLKKKTQAQEQLKRIVISSSRFQNYCPVLVL
jgi:hypothetical protein